MCYWAFWRLIVYVYQHICIKVLRNMFLTRDAGFRRSAIACILPLKKLQGALEVLFR